MGRARARLVIVAAAVGAALLIVLLAPRADERALFMERHGLRGGVFAADPERPGADAPALAAFGHADEARSVPMEPGFAFKLASLSKPLTAEVALAARDRGEFILSDPVALLAPELFAAIGDPRIIGVTVADLLRHSGGWDAAATGDPFFQPLDGPAPETCAPIARAALAERLTFTPGGRYAYSNLGYCLLSLALEERTGAPYAETVAAFAPDLTLDEAALDVPPPPRAHPAEIPAVIAPAGGWIGDAAAYWRVVRAIRRADVAPRPTYAVNPDHYYGYGWRVWPAEDCPMRTHYGAMPGYFTFAALGPGQSTYVALFAGRPSDDWEAFVDLLILARAAFGCGALADRPRP